MANEKDPTSEISAGMKAWAAVPRTDHVHDTDGGFIGEPEHTDTHRGTVWYRRARCSCGDLHNYVIDPPEDQK